MSPIHNPAYIRDFIIGLSILFVQSLPITSLSAKTINALESPTEGVITNAFVSEKEMMTDLLGMLAKFSTYIVNDFQPCQEPNSIGEECGCFRGERSMESNEAGVRTNADLSMVCAFLVKFAQPKFTPLPRGVTYDMLERYAMQSLIFAYSTHKANKLKVCKDNRYWGSTSVEDHVWESSLWAMSVAYSAFFLWDKLTVEQKGYIYKLLVAECNYQLNRTIPTGYESDTKAEENGWEADVLAATLGLFPADSLAPQWFERMRLFAVNSYSHTNDKNKCFVIDPDYDGTRYCDLYIGRNLYDDYTLQNHNLFHTSYQNVVIQELGEAALALQLFQSNRDDNGSAPAKPWHSNALMHNCQEVQDSVLNWLALTDGELAMPNGNDWSLFLYDQITSYSTLATFRHDPDCLMLENVAYKQIKARQTTTPDGSWLLRPDVQARRMGVQAHRVMMTYLMHMVNSTADMKPSTWESFREQHSQPKYFPCQNIVRAFSKDRFTTFSWSKGLKSYTGYFAQNKPDKNKIIVPYRANNTGNIIGWYEVEKHKTNAVPVIAPVYQYHDNSYVMNGELNTNDGMLNNRFAIYSTPQNAIIYLDLVTANDTCIITEEKGGMLAISTDELTRTRRDIYYNLGYKDTDGYAVESTQADGSFLVNVPSDWVNIDNEIGIVGKNMKNIAFGNRSTNNSIITSKLYPMYNNVRRPIDRGDFVDSRNLVYYSNVSARETSDLCEALTPLQELMPHGWNGVMAADRYGAYIMVCNFKGVQSHASIDDIDYPLVIRKDSTEWWAPVFKLDTKIIDSRSSVLFSLEQNNSFVQPLTIFIRGDQVKARMESEKVAYITALDETNITVAICIPGKRKNATKNFHLTPGQRIKVYLDSFNNISFKWE